MGMAHRSPGFSRRPAFSRPRISNHVKERFRERIKALVHLDTRYLDGLLGEVLHSALSSGRPLEARGQKLVRLTEFLNPTLLEACGDIWGILRPDTLDCRRLCLVTLLPDSMVRILFPELFAGLTATISERRR